MQQVSVESPSHLFVQFTWAGLRSLFHVPFPLHDPWLLPSLKARRVRPLVLLWDARAARAAHDL